MRHLSAWAAGAVAAAVVIGCGPGKQLPDEVPGAKTTERSGVEPKETIPAESDPAAKEIVDRAIKACTQGKPELLAKGRASRVTASGTIKLSPNQTPELLPVPSYRTLVARWPDHLKLTHAFKAHIPGTSSMILRGSFPWWGLDEKPNPIADPQKFQEIMLTDGLALQWLPLLFPLSEPNAVVFDPRKGESAGGSATDSVRVSIPGRPVYRLRFAPATGHLVAIEYTHIDAAGKAFKEWLLSDHAAFDGLMLPARMKMARTPDGSRTRDVVEEWTVEKWEFPEKLDDTAFDPPK